MRKLYRPVCTYNSNSQTSPHRPYVNWHDYTLYNAKIAQTEPKLAISLGGNGNNVFEALATTMLDGDKFSDFELGIKLSDIHVDDNETCNLDVDDNIKTKVKNIRQEKTLPDQVEKCKTEFANYILDMESFSVDRLLKTRCCGLALNSVMASFGIPEKETIEYTPSNKETRRGKLEQILSQDKSCIIGLNIGRHAYALLKTPKEKSGSSKLYIMQAYTENRPAYVEADIGYGMGEWLSKKGATAFDSKEFIKDLKACDDLTNAKSASEAASESPSEAARQKFFEKYYVPGTLDGMHANQAYIDAIRKDKNFTSINKLYSKNLSLRDIAIFRKNVNKMTFKDHLQAVKPPNMRNIPFRKLIHTKHKSERQTKGFNL